MGRTTIQIAASPVLANENFLRVLEPGRYLNPKTTHRDMTKYYQASFDIKVGSQEEAIEFLNNGLMREVTFFNDKAQVDWHGFINTIELDTGTSKLTASLNDMSNSVWVRYTPVGGGVPTRGAVAGHTESQNRFGTKEQVIGGGEISNHVADQIAENFLSLVYWPSPQLNSINLGGSLLPEPRLTCKCYGYWQTLMWQVYNQTVLLGVDTLSQVMTDVVTATGAFINDIYVAGNASSLTKEYDADRKGWDLVASMCDVGGQSGQLFIAFVDEYRDFYYQEAAPPQRVA